MKYLLYLSTAKLDMLFPQVEQSLLKKITAAIEVTLGPVKATVGSQGTPVANDYRRLDAVLKELEKSGDIGTVDDPGLYFRGKMPMTLGWVDEHSTVFCGYNWGADTSVVLGGSSKHMIERSPGVEPIQAAWASGHEGIALAIDRLLREREVCPEHEEDGVADFYFMAIRRPSPARAAEMAVDRTFDVRRWKEADPRPAWRDWLQDPTHLRSARSHPRMMEFFAKTLVSDDGEHGRVLIGTPLYVSLAE